MKKDSIIFDLDGTLWDSTSSVIDSWNKTLDKYDEVKNRLTVDDMKEVMGLVISDIAKIFFPYLEETKRALLYDKLEETLEELSKKYKLFIVSNCQCGYIESFFESHKLNDYFVDYECSGKTGLTKGENIKLIIKRNNLVKPVYVGDTERDLKAARFAGIPFIYARYGFGEVKEYDYVIDSFDELLNLI
jgi:phosphoglycolate phosphatase